MSGIVKSLLHQCTYSLPNNRELKKKYWTSLEWQRKLKHLRTTGKTKI